MGWTLPLQYFLCQIIRFQSIWPYLQQLSCEAKPKAETKLLPRETEDEKQEKGQRIVVCLQLSAMGSESEN